MIGTIIGDIIGSPYEKNRKYEATTVDFKPLFMKECRFTDDTVLTLATADALLSDDIGMDDVFAFKYRQYATKYPNRGYGSMFKQWVASDDMMMQNNSYSNGCMMRCSPIPLFLMNDLKTALYLGRCSVKWTHNSPESERGVSAIISAIHMSLNGKTKIEIQNHIEETYGHMLTDNIDRVKNFWDKDTIRCNVTCAQALICFLRSTDFESAVRLGVYSNGDCDTIAAIAGGIAEAFYGVRSIPKWMITKAKTKLNTQSIDLVNKFYKVVGDKFPQSEYNGFTI